MTKMSNTAEAELIAQMYAQFAISTDMTRTPAIRNRAARLADDLSARIAKTWH